MRTHRRIVAAAALGGTAVVTMLSAVPAGAVAATWPSAPSGLHVVSAGTTSLTVAVKPAAHATKYRLYASTVKSDVYYQALTHPKTQSSHLVTATSGRPQITVPVRYTTSPYYYRVAAINGSHVRYSTAYPSVYLRPAAPALQPVHDDGAGLYLRWSGSAVTGYRVEQSTSADFGSGVVTYTTHGAGRTLTPYGVAKGSSYYFRVAAVNNGRVSAWSATSAAATATTSEAPLRVATYNMLDHAYDGTKDNGGTIAPIGQRLPGQAALLTQADADVMGLQEGNSIVSTNPSTPQVYKLYQGLGGTGGPWRISAYEQSVPGKWDGNYILYKPSSVSPVGDGGDWTDLGYKGSGHNAAYQPFATNGAGARFLFVTVHIIAKKGSTYDHQRKLETADLVQRAEAYASAHGNVPILYTGDFNSWPGRYQFVDTPGTYMLSQGIPDSFEVAQARQNPQYETINQYYRTPPLGGDADHVFASPGIGVKDWHQLLHLKNGKFVGVIPSDHNPVYVDVELPY